LITAKELATIFWYFGQSIIENLMRAPEKVERAQYGGDHVERIDYTRSNSSNYIADKLNQ
jgi:hypothetical protein